MCYTIYMETVLIVGASGRIGRLLAHTLMKDGKKVIGVSRSDNEYSFEYHKVDITDQGQVELFCTHLKQSKILINGLVAIVGTSSPPKNNSCRTADLQDMSEFNKILDVNLLSTYHFIRRIRKQLKEDGSIVLFSSICSALGFPGNPAYQCSKAALEALSRSLAYDLAKDSIRCNALRLGYIKSGMTLESYSDIQKRAERSNRTLMCRWGEISEVVGPVRFLLSPESSYMTGSVLTVDGGWSAKGI